MKTFYVFFWIVGIDYVGKFTQFCVMLSTRKIYALLQNSFLSILKSLPKRYHVSIRIASRGVTSW